MMLLALLFMSGSATADDGTRETAALPPVAEHVSVEGAALPNVLGEDDARAYRAAFDAQADAKWTNADKALARLNDKSLLGHVLAERYLDPKYKPKYAELAAWLGRYADHPDAPALYRMALRAKPKGLKSAPPRPTGMADVGEKSGPKLTTDRIDPAVGTESAGEDEYSFADADFDAGTPENSASLILSGRAAEALAIAEQAVAKRGLSEGSAHWAAGLAAWRLGLYGRAADHFEATAASVAMSSQMRAAGAFWASRAHLAGKRPEKVSAWLRVAAKYPYTFYGLLAQRSLGMAPRFDWSRPILTQIGVDTLAAEQGGRRAFGLLQVGERVRAERELRQMRPEGVEPARALLALALQAELPALAMTMAHRLERLEGQRYDSAYYPIPHFQPGTGFTLDRALVFAVMRHESGFKADAKSRAGARGLMQLMPKTASFMAQDRSLAGAGRNRLYDPSYNMELGQKYLAHLLDHGTVQGDLSNLLAAYNAGPGNLVKWQRKISHGDDPLLFIEAIPVQETRAFVRHVLASYWIYRARLGQEAPSLDAIAAGRWPLYTSLDDRAGYRHAGN
jgi:soluble lytic murein transglycosylase-like protein